MWNEDEAGHVRGVCEVEVDLEEEREEGWALGKRVAKRELALRLLNRSLAWKGPFVPISGSAGRVTNEVSLIAQERKGKLKMQKEEYWYSRH